MSSIVKVDTIQENTSANGITVDGLNIKDSKLVTADSVVTNNITANAVTAAKLNNDIISGTTELASEPADTDEFLVSDAGTLKRIDYSLIKGGGITVADQWRVTSEFTTNTSVTDITANWERIDTSGQGTIGSAMSEASGIFTFPSTGIYMVRASCSAYRDGDARYVNLQILGTTNNSSYILLSEAYDSIEQAQASSTYANPTTETFVDVTDTSNVKVKLAIRATDTCNVKGQTDSNVLPFTFIRLGDT